MYEDVMENTTELKAALEANPEEQKTTKAKIRNRPSSFKCRGGCGKTFKTASRRKHHERKDHNVDGVEHIVKHHERKDHNVNGVAHIKQGEPRGGQEPSHAEHGKAKSRHRPTSFRCRGGCERTFNTASKRKNHEREHIGVEEFECTICSKMFMHPHQLRAHIKGHEGTKELFG